MMFFVEFMISRYREVIEFNRDDEDLVYRLETLCVHMSKLDNSITISSNILRWKRATIDSVDWNKIE